MKTITDQLKDVQPGQFVTFIDDSRVQVVGVVSWRETQNTGPTDRKFTIIALGGGRLLAELPEREGGKVRWFNLQNSDGMTTEEIAPYAKTFGQGKQKVKVTIDVNGVVYSLADIGAEDFSVVGEAFLSGTGKCRHIVGESDKETNFLFVDLLEGAGHDALFIGGQINPEDAIQGVE